MTEQILMNLVSQEIDWLYYYGYSEDRKLLTKDSNIYEDVQSIGYTKRKISLDTRCAPCVITSDRDIKPGIDISDLRQDSFPRGLNKLTPLEVVLKIYPERAEEFLSKIRPKNDK